MLCRERYRLLKQIIYIHGHQQYATTIQYWSDHDTLKELRLCVNSHTSRDPSVRDIHR
jgi:hypothetical protein